MHSSGPPTRDPPVLTPTVGFYLHQEGPNLGKTLCPLPPVTILLDAQFGTPTRDPPVLTPTAPLRLILAAVVVVRWSRDLNAIFIMFDMLYTSDKLL